MTKHQLLRGLSLLGLSQAIACQSGNETYQSLDDVRGAGGTGGAGGASQCDRALTEPSVEFPWLHVDGNRLKNEDGNDVVLRGVSTIDLGVTEFDEGGLIAMIDRITNRCDEHGSSPGWYPTVIRLAIYPSDSADANSPFTFQAGSEVFYEKMLRPVVDHVKARGAYAIVDWHYIGDTSEYRESTQAFWADMAPKFADDSNVIFELFNEPVNRRGGWAEVKADMQSWIDVIRKSAPKNLVLVGTPSWCQNLAETATDPIDDDNVAYVAHIYPLHFSQSKRTEIEGANAIHPVILTEWGYEAGANYIVDGTEVTYGSPYKEWVESQGMSHIAWCASSKWFSSMFDADYDLLVGPDVMGGFAKDWMYEKRNENAPFPVK